ncbi:MAG: tetratricopeptide repeat protein, partial [Proteobacteria bacterium]|nr:tetratricopeptide repeat protein [Pseudomonadota bacterium]
MSTRLREAVSALASDPSRAEAICRAIIAAAPDDRDARLVFVEALRRKGDLDAAMTEIAPLAESDANWFAAQRLLGLVLGGRGEHARAAQALSRAATLNSAHAYVWRELADELRATGDTARSGAAYLNHIHMATVDPRLAQASQALKEGQAAQARAIVEPYLAQSPTDPVALSMLAEIEAREDHPFEAEQLLRSIIDLVPDYLPARHNLSQLLMGLGKYGEALAIARYLVVRDPNNVGARKLLAAALGLVGEYASAADIYRRLLAEDASRASIWMALGHTMKTLGNAPEAIDAYRKAIALEPGLGEAYWSL